MSEGWVYVFSNKHMPGLVKIGQTANDPIKRARELENTGVPGKFEVEYQGLFDGYAQIERSVHRTLSEHRVTSNREFFRIDVARAILAIREAAPHPPKREESKEGRLRQAEQAKRQAELEESLRQEKKRIADEAYAKARVKLAEYNDKQKFLIERYVDDNYFDLWPIVGIVGMFLVIISFIFHPLIGAFSIFATYFIGKIIEDIQKEPFRIQGRSKYPMKSIEDFAENKLSSNILGDQVLSKNDPRTMQYEKSYKKYRQDASFNCRSCNNRVNLENSIGTQRVSCSKCGKSYIYDRPSSLVHPEIYDAY